MHESITFERVEAAVKSQWFGLENPGFCHACGEDSNGCEPDAQHYQCDICYEKQVFGAEETLMMLFV